jgi:hypothetical protein
MGCAGLPDAGGSSKGPAPSKIGSDAAAARPQGGRWAFAAVAAAYAAWLAALAAAAIVNSVS